MSLIDDTRIDIYNCNLFFKQSTGVWGNIHNDTMTLLIMTLLTINLLRSQDSPACSATQVASFLYTAISKVMH
jgi:hypothetical protein